MRYLIKFSKESEIKFVAHLDLMRTIQRMMKRSNLPVIYSQGFNPHLNLSLAQPLAVGVYSGGDYLDVPLLEDVTEEKVKEALNNSAPAGIKVLEVSKINDEEGKKVFKSMAAIDAASYRIKIRYKDVSNLEREMEEMFLKKEWVILKKSKKCEKETDIRPMIKDMEYRIAGNIIIVEAMISCGSRENLSPELLSQYIKGITSNCDTEAFVDIKRNEMYALSENKYIPLFKYVKSI